MISLKNAISMKEYLKSIGFKPDQIDPMNMVVHSLKHFDNIKSNLFTGYYYEQLEFTIGYHNFVIDITIDEDLIVDEGYREV
jgi:hypothetical protein